MAPFLSDSMLSSVNPLPTTSFKNATQPCEQPLFVKDLAFDLANTHEAFKETNDASLALETKGRHDPLIEDKLHRINDALHTLQTQMTQMKTALHRPARGASTEGQPSEHSAWNAAFRTYLRKGIEVDDALIRTKDMSVISDPQGGHMVPPEFSDRIVTRQFDSTPMRQLATVMAISSDALEMLRDGDEPEAQWVSELGTRADTNQGLVARIRIAVHEMHAQPRASQKIIDDAMINAEDWLVQRVASKFARLENAAFVRGDGVAMPRGFLSYPTAAQDDTTRPWGTLEHVATGVNGGFSSATGADVLITLMNEMKVSYLDRATWLLPRSAVDLIRKLKETTSNAYIWQPGLQAGVPPTLLGYPIMLAEDMPAPSAGSLSVAFGNFAEAYTIVDRLDMRVLRDPYTAAPFVKFRCSKRVGGDVVNFEAIKLLKFSA